MPDLVFNTTNSKQHRARAKKGVGRGREKGGHAKRGGRGGLSLKQYKYVMILKTVSGVLIYRAGVAESTLIKKQINTKINISYQHHLQFMQDLQLLWVGAALRVHGDRVWFDLTCVLRPGAAKAPRALGGGAGLGAVSLPHVGGSWRCSDQAIVHSKVATQSCAIAGSSAGETACWSLRQ